MDTVRNYYAELDVPPSATIEQIKEAVAKAALHMQQLAAASSTANDFKAAQLKYLVEEARKTLFDPDKRRAYDAQLKEFTDAQQRAAQQQADEDRRRRAAAQTQAQPQGHGQVPDNLQELFDKVAFFQRSGEIGLAADQARQAAKSYPKSAVAHFTLGEILILLDWQSSWRDSLRNEAVQHLLEATRLEPQNAHYQATLARAYLKNTQPVQAEQCFEAASAMSNGTDPVAKLGLIHLRFQRSSSIADLKQMHDIWQSNPEAFNTDEVGEWYASDTGLLLELSDGRYAKMVRSGIANVGKSASEGPPEILTWPMYKVASQILSFDPNNSTAAACRDKVEAYAREVGEQQARQSGAYAYMDGIRPAFERIDSQSKLDQATSLLRTAAQQVRTYPALQAMYDWMYVKTQMASAQNGGVSRGFLFGWGCGGLLVVGPAVAGLIVAVIAGLTGGAMQLSVPDVNGGSTLTPTGYLLMCVLGVVILLVVAVPIFFHVKRNRGMRGYQRMRATGSYWPRGWVMPTSLPELPGVPRPSDPEKALRFFVGAPVFRSGGASVSGVTP